MGLLRRKTTPASGKLWKSRQTALTAEPLLAAFTLVIGLTSVEHSVFEMTIRRSAPRARRPVFPDGQGRQIRL